MSIKNQCVLAFLFSLPFVVNAQKKTFTNCLNIDPAPLGQLTFAVNENQLNPDPSKPNTYPIDYKIKIYKNGKLDSTFQLRKGTKDVVIVKIASGSGSNYCVQVHRRSSVISYKQIHWTEEHDTQASSKALYSPTLYASNSARIFSFATRTITSKNGTSGDGVKVVID
jgi:hypothetical protein